MCDAVASIRVAALATPHLDFHKSECCKPTRSGESAWKFRGAYQPITLACGAIEGGEQFTLAQPEAGASIWKLGRARSHGIRLFDQSTVYCTEPPAALKATLPLAATNERQESTTSGTARPYESIDRNPR
jgi:hypothetical protein